MFGTGSFRNVGITAETRPKRATRYSISVEIIFASEYQLVVSGVADVHKKWSIFLTPYKEMYFI